MTPTGRSRSRDHNTIPRTITNNLSSVNYLSTAPSFWRAEGQVTARRSQSMNQCHLVSRTELVFELFTGVIPGAGLPKAAEQPGGLAVSAPCCGFALSTVDRFRRGSQIRDPCPPVCRIAGCVMADTGAIYLQRTITGLYASRADTISLPNRFSPHVCKNSHHGPRTQL